MINIVTDQVTYVLLFVSLMTVLLYFILIVIMKQQMDMLKNLYKMFDSEIVGKTGVQSPTASAPGERSLREQEERNRVEEERGKDPAGYYNSDSIKENLLALFSRYNLNSFTMSTSDGLVISSTDPNPEEEAAKYSYLYQQGKQPDVPNIKVIGVPHKGGTVIGIVKAEDELSEKELEFIERDIEFILRKLV